MIAVTSRLLSAGVDIPSLRNIVIFRRITSLPEFKQIIGRGTRLFPPDKFSLDIIDFVEATRLFSDPRFDGQPMRLIRDYTDEDGYISDTVDHTGDLGWESVEDPGGDYLEEEGGTLILDHKAGQESAGVVCKEFSQFIRDRILGLQLDPHQLLTQWAHPRTREELRARLDEWQVTTHELAGRAGRPEADTIDLLLHAGWGLPLLSRAERARRVETRQRDFLESFAPEAREVLRTFLDQYAARGAEELEIGALTSPAYARLGTEAELAGRFGGSDNLRSAIAKLSELIYGSP